MMSLPIQRRRVLQGMGLMGGAIVANPLISARASYATTPTWNGNVVVVLSLRGGFDGMTAIPPLGDPDYARRRPTLAVPASRALATGSTMFGLHPSLASLKPFWDAGTMNAVHAVGTGDFSRSHFETTTEIERAAPGTAIRTGWLDRAVGFVGAGGVFEAVHLGSGDSGGLLRGSVVPISAPHLSDIQLSQASWVGSRMNTALGALHTDSSSPSAPGALDILTALGQMSTVQSGSAPKNNATYPSTNLGTVMADAARLIRANVGLQALTIDFGSWDYHADLGAAGGGNFATHLKELSDSLAAFATDLGTAAMQNVTVVTISEFGRRANENGSGGLDHGYGGAMMLLGGGLNGGKVLGKWPGLTDADLQDGLDLAGTTDYRNVMADVLVKRAGVSESQISSTVFPGLTRATTGALA